MTEVARRLIPATAAWILASTALTSCGGNGEPAPDPTPFVEGLASVGLGDVRHAGIRREGGGFVLDGLAALAPDGRRVRAREVRFDGVSALSPLAAERVTVADLDAGAFRAGRVEMGRFRASGSAPVDGTATAERVEGRMFGIPFSARRLAREDGPDGTIKVRFTGLIPAGQETGAVPWDGEARVGATGGPAQVSVDAEAGTARVSVRAILDTLPHGMEARSRAHWPMLAGEARWDTARVRDLALRVENLAIPVAGGAHDGRPGPAAEIARGLAGGLTLALAYRPAEGMPAHAAWDGFVASGGRLPGLTGRVGDRDIQAR